MSKAVKTVVVTVALLVMICAVAFLGVYVYSNNLFGVQCLSGHDMTVISAKEPTCVADGCTEGAYCNRCGKVFIESNVIEATGHDVVESLGKNATCTSNGLTPKQECAVCGTLIADQKLIQPFGHQFGNWVTIQAASCEIDGTQIKRCATCGAEEKQLINRTGHSYAFSRSSPATCTVAQINTLVCSLCGKTTTESVGGPLGHLLGGYVYNNDATCTSDGTQTARCTNCNYTITSTAVGTKKGHQIVAVFGYVATCTSAGMTNGTKCGECGVTLTAQQQIPATGHSWAEATYTSPKTCTICGATSGDKLEMTKKEKHITAVNLLADFIRNNSNYDVYEGYESYLICSENIRETTQLVIYSTVIDADDGTAVAVFVKMMENNITTVLASFLLVDTQFDKFDYKFSTFGTLEAKGSGSLYPNNFDNNFSLSFDSFAGPYNVRTSCENLCHSSMVTAIEYLELIFQRLPKHNNYQFSIADLGFKSIYERMK